NPVQFYQAGTYTHREYAGALVVQLAVEPPAPGQSCDVFTTCSMCIHAAGKSFDLSLPVSVHFHGSELDPNHGAVIFAARSAKSLIGQEQEVGIPDEGEVDLAELPRWLSCTQAKSLGGHRVLRV